MNLSALAAIALVVVWFLFILSFLVIIHEMGHFLIARLLGVAVDEFGLGYPPKIRKLFRIWHTDFSLNLLPFGGFVRLYGDDAESLAPEITEITATETEKIAITNTPTGAELKETDVEKVRIERILPFSHQPKWRRLMVILAGVAVNFVFGLCAFAILFMVVGIPRGVPIKGVVNASPAEQAGLAAGDVVMSISVNHSWQIAIWDTNQLMRIIGKHRGETVRLHIERGEQTIDKDVYVRRIAETPAEQGSMGVQLDYPVLHFYPWWQMPWRGAWQGWLQSVELTRLIVDALGTMVMSAVQKHEVPQDVAGPVGIVREAVQAHILDQGWLASVQFTAALSVNLAVMNLLPIPALDGGRALFVILESVIGRKRRAQWEQRTNAIGFALLIILILLVTINDIRKWFI